MFHGTSTIPNGESILIHGFKKDTATYPFVFVTPSMLLAEVYSGVEDVNRHPQGCIVVALVRLGTLLNRHLTGHLEAQIQVQGWQQTAVENRLDSFMEMLDGQQSYCVRNELVEPFAIIFPC